MSLIYLPRVEIWRKPWNPIGRPKGPNCVFLGLDTYQMWPPRVVGQFERVTESFLGISARVVLRGNMNSLGVTASGNPMHSVK